MMLQRILSLKAAIKFMFSEQRSSEEEDSVGPADDAIARVIDAQIERYKAEKYPLLNTETQKYNCPLV